MDRGGILELVIKSILKMLGVYPQSKSYKARIIDKPVVFNAKTRLVNDLKLESDIHNLTRKLDLYLKYLQKSSKSPKKTKLSNLS